MTVIMPESSNFSDHCVFSILNDAHVQHRHETRPMDDGFAPCGLVIRIGKVNGEEVLRNLNFIHTVQIMDLVTGTKRLLSFGVA